MPQLDPIQLREVSEGIIQKIDNALSPENSVRLGVNLLFHDDIGRAVLRDGTSTLGDDLSALSGECQGLYQFIKSDGSSRLLSVFGDSIYSLENGTWIEQQPLAGTLNDVRFITFLDTVLALTNNEQLTSEDGLTWTASGGRLDVENMPEGRYAAHYLDKVYISGVVSNPNRVYFSSLPESGAISWTDETAGWFDVAPEDGSGNIVGLEKVPGYLLIFKERSIYRWDGKQLAPEALVNIGAQSNEAICLGRETVFFWNERGIFETSGGYPQKISRRIQDIVEAVDSNYKVASWSDKENVYFSIGDIDIYGLNLKNCVVMYNIDNQVFSLLSFPNQMIRFTDYVNGGRNLIAGDDDGNVWNVFDGVGDDGESINWILQYQEQEIEYRSRVKDLSAYIVFTEKVNNGTLYIKADDEDFKPVGTFRDNVSVIKEDVRGNYFSFRLSGSGKSGKIIGLEIPIGHVNFSHEL